LSKGGYKPESYSEQPFDSFKYTRANLAHSR
jgi:hypothetical protein